MSVTALDRIRFDRTHIVGSIDPVNPVYIYKVEQIHAVDGIAHGDSHQPRSALDRIDPVNPVTIYKLEQSHGRCWDRRRRFQATPIRSSLGPDAGQV